MKTLKDVKIGETAKVVKLHGEGQSRRNLQICRGMPLVLSNLHRAIIVHRVHILPRLLLRGCINRHGQIQYHQK